MMPNFTHVRAATVNEAVERSSREGARIHAGGTDLLGCLRDQVFPAKTVVSLSGLDDLRGIRETSDGGLEIGALTTIRDLSRHAAVRERYRALAQAAGEVASPQLRAQGTLGGNLCQKPRCWYYRGEFHCLRKGGDTCFAIEGANENHCIFGGDGCYMVHPSDTAPALAALGAQVEITGPRGRRTLPLASFHLSPRIDPRRETVLEPGEILTRVLLPQPEAGLRSAYRKIRARRSWDFALAGAAVAVTLKDGVVGKAHVFLSGAAPVPWRSTAVEEELQGRPLDESALAGAAEAVVKGAEPMSGNAYKIPLFKGCLREALRDLG